MAHAGWRAWCKTKNHAAFFRCGRNGFKFTLENRIFIPVSNASYRAVNTYGHSLQRKTLLQTRLISKMLLTLLAICILQIPLQATKDKIEIKYVGQVISNRAVKHSSFTSLPTQRSGEEDWQLLHP